MRSASRVSPKVHIAVQYIVRNSSRSKTLFLFGLTKSKHKLPPVTYADSGTLLHYDINVNPYFHHETEGAPLAIQDVTGSAHSRIIKRLESTTPRAGLDQDMTIPEE
eukprot:8858746-Pyramimonas_sp.AAC.1